MIYIRPTQKLPPSSIQVNQPIDPIQNFLDAMKIKNTSRIGMGVYRKKARPTASRDPRPSASQARTWCAAEPVEEVVAPLVVVVEPLELSVPVLPLPVPVLVLLFEPPEMAAPGRLTVDLEASCWKLAKVRVEFAAVLGGC